MKSADFLKVRLKSGDTLARIFEVVKKVEAPQIIFFCPRDLAIFGDTSFLKKLKERAEEYAKTLIFVTDKKYFEQNLKRYNFRVYSECPEELDLGDMHEVGDILKIEKAGKNPEQKDFGSEEKPGNGISFSPKIIRNEPRFSTQKIESTLPERSKRGVIFFLFLFVILGLLWLWFWISPRAEIIIKPKVDTVEMTQNVLVALPNAQIPEENETLPQIKAIFVETEVMGKEAFPSTKKKYDLTNAKGEITLFNETSDPKFLVPSRLSTVDGKVLRFKKEITIPPGDESGPGRKVVFVEADAYDGEENPIGGKGNLEAGTELHFPALRKDTRELYYGKVNRGPLVGGSTLTHFFVGENDFELARPLLEQEFRSKALEKLRGEIAEQSNREAKKYVLLDEGPFVKTELEEYITPDELVGTESQTFEVFGKLKLSGVVFDQSQVVDFLAEKIRKTLDHRKKLMSIDEQSIDYSILDSDIEAGWIKLSVSIFGIETLDLEAENPMAQKWESDLRQEIAGKSEKSARATLLNHPEIEGVRGLEISPFWIETMPAIYDQIELQIVD